MNFWDKKKVFITGHTGFKGSWLSKALLSFGSEVTGYALKPEETPNIFSLINLEGEMPSFYGDIRDSANLKKIIHQIKPDIVFHLAAQPLVRESYRNPVYTYETNVIGTVNLLDALSKSDSVRSIVNVTTDKVYLNLEKDIGYTEDEVLCGFDPYSNSKSCSELVTYSYRKSFYNGTDAPALSTARSGNVIGGGDFAKDRIIPDCIHAATNNTPILVRNPHSIRPYQHVLECLSGYMLLAEMQYDDKQRYEGSYNFGPDDLDCIQTAQLVETFCNIWYSTVKTNKPPIWKSVCNDGPHETCYLKLNNEKSKKILGWNPKWDIDKAILKTVEWTIEYLSNGEIASSTIQQIDDFFY